MWVWRAVQYCWKAAVVSLITPFLTTLYALQVIKYGATWCGPCKVIAPAVEKMSEEYDDVTFLDIDIDIMHETASEASVTSVPTFHLIKNNNLVRFNQTWDGIHGIIIYKRVVQSPERCLLYMGFLLICFLERKCTHLDRGNAVDEECLLTFFFFVLLLLSFSSYRCRRFSVLKSLSSDRRWRAASKTIFCC